MNNTDKITKLLEGIEYNLQETYRNIHNLGVDPERNGIVTAPVGATDVLSDAILNAADKIANGLYAVAESIAEKDYSFSSIGDPLSDIASVLESKFSDNE